MTARFAIAKYWASDEGFRRWRSANIDLGEPSCMACGYFARRWDEARTANARWNESALERAHIVAASAGGPDVPSNYVLLCAKCHAAAPMTRDDRVMFAWCERRTSHAAAQINELRNELVGLGVDLHSLTGLAALPFNELRERLNKAAGSLDAGSHLCHMSASTRAATLALMAEELAATPATQTSHSVPAKPAHVADPRQLSLLGAAVTPLASILGALAAPSVTPVRVTPRPRRCDVAAMLTEALRGKHGADAAIAAESKRLARELAWRGTTTHEAIREATRLACVLRDRCAEHAEPATMVLAVIRELLTDAARDGAMELDALARDAARAQGSITAAHEAEAARMVTEVMG